METPFTVSKLRYDGLAILIVGGELDLATAPQLEAMLSEQRGSVYLDCADLDFIDASGLGILVRAHLEREARGERLVICRVPDRLLRVLRVAHLDTTLHVNNNL
jgi:anti-sigma B factor antagonist